MARGKIAITRIENRAARQVTFSKRRVGLFKKTRELSVLCDAEIGLIVFSSNGKLSEFCSESSSIPHIIKRYEISRGMRVSESNDLEQILKELKRIRKETDDLQLSMRCYKGESLSSLHYEDLVELEKQLECSVNKVRARKFELLQQQVDNLRRKEKMLEVENQQIQYHLHQVATLKQQHAAVAMVKPEEQQRMLEEFQFSGDEQRISNLLQLAPLPPQFQPCRVQPTQPNLQDSSLSIPDPSNYMWQHNACTSLFH
ncbi:hypothetical protein POTOM_050881 [Populus tomentosa]|uniref:Uncharacterized protein n=1 Tax=Populus tomentosa TaxID=118781 RepID=A0A8X7Y914_POPTO|nr:hypothetical protein POTOM_050881 [Populus tomentosa]